MSRSTGVGGDWPGRVIDGERRVHAVGLARLRRDASLEGRVEVEVTDAGGPLEGCSREDCLPISTDSTDVILYSLRIG